MSEGHDHGGRNGEPAILRDLVDEFDRLEMILAALSSSDWRAESSAPGWSIRDVVVHLAQTEEGVLATLQRSESVWATRDHPLDDVIAAQVRNDTMSASQAFERWRAARRASVVALRNADPMLRVRWAAAPLRPMTLATTRLAEHWAHGLDITTPLGIPFHDTDRLRHIAWLGHATLPYALALHSHAPIDLRCELTMPTGNVVVLGATTTQHVITGSAGEFCRVGAKRRDADASSLATSDDEARLALRALRNYAA